MAGRFALWVNPIESTRSSRNALAEGLQSSAYREAVSGRLTDPEVLHELDRRLMILFERASKDVGGSFQHAMTHHRAYGTIPEETLEDLHRAVTHLEQSQQALVVLKNVLARHPLPPPLAPRAPQTHPQPAPLPTRAPRPRPQIPPFPWAATLRLLKALLPTLSILSVGGGIVKTSALFGIASIHGHPLADEALDSARIKTGIEVLSYDGEPLGYLYGAATGVPETIAGIDRSIPILEEDLEEGGRLHLYYRALMALEDNQFDSDFSEGSAWSDRTGINSRMPFTVLLREGGGSSLYDQTCGALRDGLDIDRITEEDRRFWAKALVSPLDSVFPASVDWVTPHLSDRVVEKLEETSCGMGLAQGYAPTEVAVQQATYTYLGPKTEGIYRFAQRYWGFSEGVYDERIGPEHQLILAALARYPWAPNHEGKQWYKIRDRAQLAARRLAQDGIISSHDLSNVLEAIDRARPFEEGQRISDAVVPKKGFEIPFALIPEELERELGPDWRSQVTSVRTTIRIQTQHVLMQAAHAAETKVNADKAHPIGMVVRNDGAIEALYTDDRVLNRFRVRSSKGSLGKTLLAAGVADRGLDRYDIGDFKPKPPKPRPDDFLVDVDPITGEVRITNVEPKPISTYNPLESFSNNLEWSRSAIIDDARRLGVDPDFVLSMAQCYGTTNFVFQNDPIRHAALGNWGLSVEGALAMMHDLSTGDPMKEPYVVASYTMRDHVLPRKPFETPYYVETSPENELSPYTCASRMASTWRTENWMEYPLGGTAKGASRVLDFGKTGTVCTTNPRHQTCTTDKTNTAVWIAGGAFIGSTHYTGVFGVMADTPTTPISTSGWTSMNVATPMAATVFEHLQSTSRR